LYLYVFCNSVRMSHWNKRLLTYLFTWFPYRYNLGIKLVANTPRYLVQLRHTAGRNDLEPRCLLVRSCSCSVAVNSNHRCRGRRPRVGTTVQPCSLVAARTINFSSVTSFSSIPAYWWWNLNTPHGTSAYVGTEALFPDSKPLDSARINKLLLLVPSSMLNCCATPIIVISGESEVSLLGFVWALWALWTTLFASTGSFPVSPVLLWRH